MSEKKIINIVWLKRDLRLTDHLPLYNAIQKQEDFIILYIYEPLLMRDVHYDERHWRFIQQSLSDIQEGSASDIPQHTPVGYNCQLL